MMDCLECRNLDRTFQRKLAMYLAARSAPFCQVSTKIAARKRVDMERAKNDMEEHLLACPFAVKASGPEKAEVISPSRDSNSRLRPQTAQ
jgi:hypothetical protein